MPHVIDIIANKQKNTITTAQDIWMLCYNHSVQEQVVKTYIIVLSSKHKNKCYNYLGLISPLNKHGEQLNKQAKLYIKAYWHLY